MSILSKMSKLFEIATSVTKSRDIAIDELIRYSKIDVPLEFLEIIREREQNLKFWLTTKSIYEYGEQMDV